MKISDDIMQDDLSFRLVVRELNEAQQNGDWDWLQSWVSTLPLDEEAFVVNTMKDLEKISEINEAVTVTEKLRIVSALWAAFKADKMLQTRSPKSFSKEELMFLDIIRKREGAALNQLSKLREGNVRGVSLEDIMDDLSQVKEKTVERPEEKKFSKD